MLHRITHILLVAAFGMLGPVAPTVHAGPGFPEPPVITDPAWLDWYDALLMDRLGASPIDRSQQAYFAADGNDETGDGSQDAPFRTLSKAQELIDASPGDLAILFRRGDVFRERLGLEVDTPDITIGAWGSGDRPTITGFEPISWLMDSAGAYPAWTRLDPETHENVWSVSLTEPVLWVRDVSEPLADVFMMCGSYDEVGSPITDEGDPIDRAWWYDDLTGVLHVLVPPGGPQPTLEGVVSFENGLHILSDGVRVDGLHVTGWGMERRTSQAYCIRLSPRDDERVVVSDCVASYSSSHVIGQWSSIGGCVTIVDCKADFGLTDGAGAPTVFNAYGDRGEHQAIFDGCEVEYGALPEYGRPSRTGRAFFGHTRGFGFGWRTELIVAMNNVTRDRRFGCQTPSSFNDVPRADQLSRVRVFQVNELFEGGENSGRGLPLAQSGQVRMNGRYLNIRLPDGTPEMFGGTMTGWAINCTFEVDFSQQSTRASLWDQPAGQSRQRPNFWHCRFDLVSTDDLLVRLDRSDVFDAPVSPCGQDGCSCDRDENGEVSSTDLLDFLASWFTLEPDADYDGDGETTVQDLLLYLTCWFESDTPNAPISGAVIANSILSHTGPGRAVAMQGNGWLDLLESNAYYGFDPASFDIDPNALQVESPIATDRPSCTDAIANRASSLPNSNILEYDQSGVVAPRMDLGPLESLQCGDFNLDGEVTITDFLLFVDAWLINDADYNRDGQTSVVDLLQFTDVWLDGTP